MRREEPGQESREKGKNETAGELNKQANSDLLFSENLEFSGTANSVRLFNKIKNFMKTFINKLQFFPLVQVVMNLDL
jgi:hypothetical protein